MWVYLPQIMTINTVQWTKNAKSPVDKPNMQIVYGQAKN